VVKGAGETDALWGGKSENGMCERECCAVCGASTGRSLRLPPGFQPQFSLPARLEGRQPRLEKPPKKTGGKKTQWSTRECHTSEAERLVLTAYIT